MIEIGLNDLLPTATFKLREAGRYGFVFLRILLMTYLLMCV